MSALPDFFCSLRNTPIHVKRFAEAAISLRMCIIIICL